jgi:iron complex outermembrane receptor protein
MHQTLKRMLLCAACICVPIVAHAQETELPTIQVIGSSPVAGDSIDRDKVPTDTQSLIADDFDRNKSASVLDTLSQQTPGLQISDVQGNPFSQDINLRGFRASATQGTPQGLAVYMNGVRINEAFGDTVNFDLVPTVAIDRADVWTSNPVFGLNALGGAINLQLKNGFTYDGLEAEVTGGSFGRIGSSLQYGAQKDNWAFYTSGEEIHEDGWRDQSSSRIKRFYTDLGYKDDEREFHLSLSGASNTLGVIGPTPVEELARKYSSVYTFPQTTENNMLMIGLNGKVSINDDWAVQSNIYVRHFDQKHVDGNTSDVAACAGDPTQLCLGDAATQNARSGENLSSNLLPGSGLNQGIAGSIDRTHVDSDTVGASLQTTYDGSLLKLNNHFVAGANIDYSSLSFSGSNELGTIPDTTIDPYVIGSGITYQTSDGLIQPVRLRAKNTYQGLFSSDTLDITDRLSATLGARLNIAQINLSDALGNSPELTGDHRYARLNPLTGLTYKLTPDLTVYGGYSEANRAPTPLELGCANPAKPCLLEGFLVSDPTLKQVVSKTYEAGLRGHSTVGADSTIDWKLGAFRTNNTDDIVSQPSSLVPGYGYYVNAGKTRRQGIDAYVQYRTSDWSAYTTLAYVDATYQSNLSLTSANNPQADANGNIAVARGEKIPGISPWQLKMGGDYKLTPALTLGADMIANSSQYYVGDDSNQNAKLAGYAVFNVHSDYQLTKTIKLFAKLDNALDRKYATYGTFASVGDIPSLGLSNPQTITPAAPRAMYAGFNVKF